MDIIRFAIDRPVAVMAAVIMAVLFGILAVSRIPIQLAPDVRKPIVVITTNWPGAAPSEIEREIVNPQEEALRGLDGLEIMTSRARTGEAEVTLEFGIGTDMGQSLLLVSNRLDRVGDYPEEAGEPTLDTSGSDDSPIAWVLLTAKEGDLATLRMSFELGSESPLDPERAILRRTTSALLARRRGLRATTVVGGGERSTGLGLDLVEQSFADDEAPED